MLTGSNPRSQDTVTTEKTASDNFGILSRHAPLLEQLCASLERNLTSPEPNTCLLKLQQFGEALAQHVAALLGIAPPRSQRRPTFWSFCNARTSSIGP